MYTAEAYHLEKKISIGNFRKKIPHLKIAKREHSFLLCQVDENSYLYVKDYGSLVFINCKKPFIKQIIELVDEIKTTEELPIEKYTIYTEQPVEVDFEMIAVPELNLDTAHIIMLNLAQSVALMNYVAKTSELHDQTLVYSKQLEETGKIKLKEKPMRKFIGRTMNLKNNIAENLFVFDTPELAWNNKDLSALDYKLKDELDIVNRYQGIKNSLDTIKENLDLFSDILQHKYGTMLEWIVIILILIEVLQVFIH
ncbi:MAG: RMD1 family protein [Flavobacteriaceae bacterium]|nr:RMD1 family protein [Flavobacteriaceae bacterium]